MTTIPIVSEGANQFDTLPTSQRGSVPQTVFENEATGITMPQNQNTLGQLIDAQFVQSFGSPEPYDKVVANAYDVLSQPQQIGPQGAALYPGLSEPINVGNYSGSIVGSNTLFAPSGNIFPLDPVLARRKAIDEAARARAQQALQAVEAPKVPQFKDQGFQKKLTEDVLSAHNQFVKEAQSISPQNWAAILQNPNTSVGRRYIQTMANFENIVKNVDRITDQVVAIEEGMKDGSVSLNPEGKRLFQEYKGMLGDFTNYEKLASTDMRNIERRLQGIIDINKYLNDEKLLQTIEAEIKSSYVVNDKGMYYNARTNKLTKFDDVIKDVTESLANSTTFSFAIENGYLTKDDINSALAARLKNKQEVTGTMSQKQEWAFNFGRGIDVPNPNEANAFVTYTNEDGKRGVVEVDGKRYESLADYNMTAQGTERERLVLGKDGKPSNVKIKGVSLNDIQVTNGRKTDIKGGSSIVQLGEMTLLSDGRVAQKSVVYRPQKREVFVDGVKKTVEVWEGKDELVILEHADGKGTSAKSQISTQLKRDNVKAGENYINAVTKMGSVRKQEQGIQNVMNDNGISRQEAIEALKAAGKL